jgi:hypothetical protein
MERPEKQEKQARVFEDVERFENEEVIEVRMGDADALAGRQGKDG